MGNCLSENIYGRVCHICDKEINDHKRHLRCNKCHALMHIKCLYNLSNNMNLCAICHVDNVCTIDNNKNSGIWSGKWPHSESLKKL